MKRHALSYLLCTTVLFLAYPQSAHTQHYDVVIAGGHVLDGSGNPWMRADVGIRGDRIVAVGDLSAATADRVIDATGKTVTPGFIDIHSHAAGPIYGPRGVRSPDARRRAAPNLVAQGITTLVGNQDGRSVWPIADQKAALEELGFGPNTILLVGHGTVRREVMGDDFHREATPAEVDRMRNLVRQGMAEGAYGMSAGLEYVPGRWSTTDEVVALVEEIVPYHGVYISHERSEGADPMWYWPSQYADRPPSLLDAVIETIEIGERTGATVVASHIKAKGANYWGASQAVIRLINEARARGVAVYADQYPYNTTGSDGSTVLIPGWIFTVDGLGGERGQRRDYAQMLRAALANDSLLPLIRMDIQHEIARRGGAEQVVVMDYPDASHVGKSIAQLAQANEISHVDMAIKLQLEGYANRRGGARVRGFSLSEYDIEPYAAQPWTATATDGWINLPEDGPTHARVYGTYPRKIRRYALDRGLMSVGDAVRSATSLPAQILGSEDRGMVKQGYVADLVVLDLNELRDNSTFFEPHQYPSGVDFVFINGTLVVDDGELTWALPGVVIGPQQGPIEATGDLN
jgi:N-acyl-D-aspartate/D-glutamate deacylase